MTRCHVISERENIIVLMWACEREDKCSNKWRARSGGHVIAFMTSRPFHCSKLRFGGTDFSPRGSVTAGARLALSVPKLLRLTRHSFINVKYIEANTC